MADDLSKFRKNWLNELKHRRHSNPSTSSASSSTETQTGTKDDDFASQGNKISKKSDYSLKQLSDEKHRINLFYQYDLPEHDQFVVNAEKDVKQQNQNVHCECENQADLTTVYYPFRILTALLNHASTEQGPKHIRRANRGGILTAKTTTVPKRTYFSLHDDIPEHCGAKKRNKEGMTGERDEEGKDNKRYLDLFISDLDEISEISFFDVSLPREVAIKIFQYLGILDLCRCAQVSKSWRSLAEDELLWCHICHEVGFEKDAFAVEHDNWKSRVRHYSIIKHTLELNWKNRTGKLYNLHHAKGGVLCAVHSYKSTIVAGYSNCQTKLWDVMSGETCIFQPSSTALLIDETEDEGTICNEVLHVATCNKITAATYSHGFVDVWDNDVGTEAMYTFTCGGNGRFQQPTSLQLLEDHSSVCLAVSYGNTVQVHSVQSDEGGQLKEAVDFDSFIKKTAWLQTTNHTAPSSPTLIIATNCSVSALALHGRGLDLLELHNIVDAPVSCMDARGDINEVVVGFTLNTGPAQYFKVNVYDILKNAVSSTLIGHTASICCINSAESPQFQLVTGSQDRKVRVFDTRVASLPLMTLIGHSAPVTTVQIDSWKVVSGDEAGFVCVWDQRMASKLWEMNNRHPVRFCHFEERELVVGHVPYVKHQFDTYDFDSGLHQRHRGSLHVYDFLADQKRQGVPEICLSSFDEPQGYNYNITLAVPYDLV